MPYQPSPSDLSYHSREVKSCSEGGCIFSNEFFVVVLETSVRLSNVQEYGEDLLQDLKQLSDGGEVPGKLPQGEFIVILILLNFLWF